MARNKDEEEQLQEVNVEGRGTTRSTTNPKVEEVNGVSTTPHQNPNAVNTTNAAQETPDDGTVGTLALSGEETPTGTGTETGTPTETEATDDTGGDTGAGGGYTAPMPVRGNRYSDKVGQYNAPYTQKELDKAKKKGRRESRMATAGRVMDALARVANFAATTQGAPSARWDNKIQDVDPSTYYARLKGANDQARKDYMDMIFKANAADNNEYATALKGWREGNKDKREDELQHHRIKELVGKANKAEAEAEIKKIAAKYAPEESEAKINKLREEEARAAAQRDSARASAANSAALAELHKSQARKGEYHFMGKTYHSIDEYKKQVNKFWAEHRNDADPISRTEELSYTQTSSAVGRKSTSKEKEKDIHLLAGELENRYMKGTFAGGQ